MKTRATAKALILLVILALPGASTSSLAHAAESSMLYRFFNSSLGPGPLPDLIIKSATFHPSKAIVVVQNVGSAPSGEADVALLLLWGTDPSSKVTNRFDKPVPPLSPGQIFNTYFDIGSLTFVKHARRIMVDATKVIAESNENNNVMFNSDFVAEQGAFPEPSDSLLSNLTFSMVKFIAPNSVHYCVKNIGYTPSVSYKVRTTIFAGAKKDSGLADMNQGPYEKNPFSIPGNILKPNAVACQNFTFATVDGKSVMEGRGRLVEIILDNGAKDADSANKSHFSPGIEGLWQPKN